MDQFYSCHLPYAINSKQQLQHKAGTAIQLELSGTIHHEDAKTDGRMISGCLELLGCLMQHNSLLLLGLVIQSTQGAFAQ